MVDRSWGGVYEQVRRCHTGRGRRASGRYAIEGIRLHERALRAGTAVEATLVGRSLANSDQPRHQALLSQLKAGGTSLVVAPDAILAELTAGRGLGDLVGIVPLPVAPHLTQLTAGRPLLLVAVNVKDAGNSGALVRSGHAFGIRALIAVGDTDPYHPRAVRTSMGSIFKVPILRQPEIGPLLEMCRTASVQLVGAISQGGIPLPEASFAREGIALLVGDEYWGLSQDAVSALDLAITIPMVEGIDSLSLNAATAVALYQIRTASRQGMV